MDKTQIRKAIIYLTIGISSILLLPNLFTTGMFMDGLIYSTISLNMSEGLGSFWKPFYDGLNSGIFYEHPPFFFWIQSFWFKIFGNFFFVERVFDLIVLLFSCIIVFKISNKILKKELHFLPILFTLFIPKFVWCFSNNMMEIILVPITLMAFFIFQLRTKKQHWWHLLAGAFLFIVFVLIKGPVALGILAIPFCFMVNRGIKATIIDALFLAFLSVIGIFLLIQNDEARLNLETYFNQQILASINGSRPSEYTNNRFFILFGIVQQLLIPIILLSILWFAKFQKLKITKENTPFLLTALLFSLPFLIFKKQHIYYILPSIPFYVFFLIIIFQNIIIDFLSKLPFKILQLLTNLGIVLLLIGIGLSIINYNKPNRDEALQNDLRSIASVVEKNKVSVSKELEKNWGLFAFSSRFRLVDFDNHTNNIYMVSSQLEHDGFEKISISTTKFHLFKKTN